ncbi:hypothetical protein ACIBF6_02650 [Streptosporangium amethystogenes]
MLVVRRYELRQPIGRGGMGEIRMGVRCVRCDRLTEEWSAAGSTSGSG